MDIKFPDIEVELSDQDGNASSIMGRVRKAMRRGGCSDEEIEAFTKECTEGDYDHLLQVVMRTVETS